MKETFLPNLILFSRNLFLSLSLFSSWNLTQFSLPFNLLLLQNLEFPVVLLQRFADPENIVWFAENFTWDMCHLSHWSCLNVYFTFEETREKWNCQRLDYWCHYLPRWEVESVSLEEWQVKTCCAKILYLLSQDLNGSPKRETISQNYFFLLLRIGRKGKNCCCCRLHDKDSKGVQETTGQRRDCQAEKRVGAAAKETHLCLFMTRKWRKWNLSWQRGCFYLYHPLCPRHEGNEESTSVCLSTCWFCFPFHFPAVNQCSQHLVWMFE